MMSRLFKVILLLFMLTPVIVVLYDVLETPKVLTRENNKGNEFEQLDRLGKNKLSIESPIDKTIHIFTDGNHDLIIFNKDMNITGSVMNQGKDKPSRKLTEEEKSKYEKEIKQEINKLLDDVYKGGEK